MEKGSLGLIITFALGLFILIGTLIAFFFKRKEKIVDFSIGLAFGVITMLILTDLIPEAIENLEDGKIYILPIFVIVGFALLALLDRIIPAHHHDHHHDKHHDDKECNHNLTHIGIITSLALALHNIIEGMAVYSTVLSSTSLGITLTLGVGFHNIPMGMVIGSALYQSKSTKLQIIINILLVSLSTFVGGLIMYALKLEEMSSLVLGVLLSITLGMLIYIVVDELLPRVKETENKKVNTAGILVGIIILLIASFIGE